MKEELSVEQVQAQAFEMGMAPSELGDLLNQYGPQVVSVVGQALKNGFSLPFVLELVRLFGPVSLDFIISLFKAKKEVSAQGMSDVDPFVQLNDLVKNDASFETLLSDDTDLKEALGAVNIQGLTPKLVSVLVEKLLPFLVQKYGPQLLAAVIKGIEDWTNTNTKE